MRYRAIQSNLSFSFPSDAETDQEFTTVEQAQQLPTGEVPNSTIVSNDPPPKSPREEAFKPPSDEEHSSEFMLDDDNTYVGALPILTTFKTLQKPSSSKLVYDFSISSSSSEDEGEIKIDADTQGNKTKFNPVVNTEPFEPQNDDDDDDDDNDRKSESSTSNTGSSDENIADPFALLELRDKVASVVSKVESLDNP